MVYILIKQAQTQTRVFLGGTYKFAKGLKNNRKISTEIDNIFRSILQSPGFVSF